MTALRAATLTAFVITVVPLIHGQPQPVALLTPDSDAPVLVDCVDAGCPVPDRAPGPIRTVTVRWVHEPPTADVDPGAGL